MHTFLSVIYNYYILVLVCVYIIMNMCIHVRAYRPLCRDWMDCGTGNLPCVCVHMCLSERECVYVCVCICVCVCVCVCVHAYCNIDKYTTLYDTMCVHVIMNMCIHVHAYRPLCRDWRDYLPCVCVHMCLGERGCVCACIL